MREMKESGVPWIGRIPLHWQINRIKYEFYIVNGYSFKSSEYSEDGIRVIRISDVEDDHLSDKDIRYYPISFRNQIGDAMIRKGDILITLTGYLGKCYLVDDFEVELGLNQRVGALRIKGNAYNTSYMKRIIQCEPFRKEMELSSFSSAQLNMSTEWFMNNKTPCPSIKEQMQITAFLDLKCAEIDALSADIQSEIDTLEAYKRSKVFDTVLHGIDHNNFVQTESDVWSTIPVGWKLVDIKYLFEIVKRIAGKEGYDIIAITQQGLKYKDISSNEGQLASDYSGYQFVYPGDFAMNHMDLLTGWVDLSDKFGVTSPDYRVFRLRYPDAYDRKYYKYVMQCCYMNRIFYTLGQGVSNLGRWRLQTSAFNNFKVPVPPYDEQIRLGQYLENEISQIDKIIAQKQEQLSILADYKKSLIYEYVTGKKEVPMV